MVNRYQGNTGRVQRIPEPQRAQSAPPVVQREQRSEPAQRLPQAKKPPPRPAGGGIQGSIQTFLRRLSPGQLDQEDILLLLILYLLYRESGNREFLIMLGAFLVL